MQALQDIAIRFAELFVGLRLSPPLFLHTLGATLVVEQADDLSRTVAREQRLHESQPTPCHLIAREAQRLGEEISLDLFASAAATSYFPRSST